MQADWKDADLIQQDLDEASPEEFKMTVKQTLSICGSASPIWRSGLREEKTRPVDRQPKASGGRA